MRSTFAANVNLLDWRRLSGANATEGKFEVPREASMLLVSVKRGSVDIWFGDFLNSRELVPHLHYGQTNAPVWVPIPVGTYVITYRLEDLTSPNQIIASVLLGG